MDGDKEKKNLCQQNYKTIASLSFTVLLITLIITIKTFSEQDQFETSVVTATKKS